MQWHLSNSPHWNTQCYESVNWGHMFSRYNTINTIYFSKHFEWKMPRNPRSVDLKEWYQISAKLHKTFENILTCKVIKMRPTNWSFKNYVAHSTATAAAADDMLIHGIICQPVLDSWTWKLWPRHHTHIHKLYHNHGNQGVLPGKLGLWHHTQTKLYHNQGNEVWPNHSITNQGYSYYLILSF